MITCSESRGVKLVEVKPLGNYRLFNKGPTETKGSQYRNIISAFLSPSHEVVCAGYAPSFKYCCDKYGIPCISVSGMYADSGDFNKAGAHQWNYVELEGKWYQVDPLHNDNNRNNKSKLLLGSDNTQNYRASVYSTNSEDYIDYPDLSVSSFYQYTIKFVDWDGKVISEKVCLPGEFFDVPEDPSREGYHFRGWLGLKAANNHYAEKDETFTANYYGGYGGSGSSDPVENQSICASSVALMLVVTLSVAALPVIRFLRP